MLPPKNAAMHSPLQASCIWVSNSKSIIKSDILKPIKGYPECEFINTIRSTSVFFFNKFNKISSSLKLNSEFETSLSTTKIISDILQKGRKKWNLD